MLMRGINRSYRLFDSLTGCSNSKLTLILDSKVFLAPPMWDIPKFLSLSWRNLLCSFHSSPSELMMPTTATWTMLNRGDSRIRPRLIRGPVSFPRCGADLSVDDRLRQLGAQISIDREAAVETFSRDRSEMQRYGKLKAIAEATHLRKRSPPIYRIRNPAIRRLSVRDSIDDTSYRTCMIGKSAAVVTAGTSEKLPTNLAERGIARKTKERKNESRGVL